MSDTNRPIDFFNRFDRRAVNIRLILSESICFGILKHDLFDKCMEDINNICLSENNLLEFLRKKGLENEYTQFCNYGTCE